MNGVHDMGGMHNLGAIEREENEPVFHERWEGRIWALRQALKPWRKRNADTSRYAGSMIPPAEYLRMSYYERHAAALVELLVASGLVTREEIENGKPAQGSPKSIPPLTAALAAEIRAAADLGEPDDGSRYYEYWLAALERLVTAKGLSDPVALRARKEAWAEAYRHTPHGKPVKLTTHSK